MTNVKAAKAKPANEKPAGKKLPDTAAADIRAAAEQDLSRLVELALLLWPKHAAEDLTKEFAELLKKTDARFFLKYVEREPVGFAQCQIRRDYVEGTSSSPAGYLEAIFIRESFRRKGFAGELVSACESWTKSMGCSEMGSDCKTDNEVSRMFHSAAGFKEINRIICFSKKL